MSFTNRTLPYVKRNPALTALATIALATGVAFVIRGGTASTNYVDKRVDIVTCTATGGLAQYSYCNWQEPSGNAGSGSVVTGIYYVVGKNPKVIGVDITVGSSATVSGATALTNLTNINTSTGAFFRYTTGATLVTEGNYIRAVTLTNPTAAHKASLIIESISRLSR